MSNQRPRAYDKFEEPKSNVYTGRQIGSSTHPKLPPGVYNLGIDMNTGTLLFQQIETNSDGLLPLPTNEFKAVVEQIEIFLKPETKALFDKYRFLYKRSSLLYGPPGTGKTCLVNQVADHVKNVGGIVLFNPNPKLLSLAFSQLTDIQPESTVLVIFEELDTLLIEHEGTLLSLLDGEIQKNNVIYMATTNYIENIPARIKRPGRFSNVLEVGFPTAEIRETYLRHKLGDEDLSTWVEKTEGFSIDELKETVLSVKCLGLDFEATIKKVREIRAGVTKDEVLDEAESKADDDNLEYVSDPYASALKTYDMVNRTYGKANRRK